MSKAEQARRRFDEGFSCAPAVLSTYSQHLGLEEALALKIACGFGGGIGRMGRTCSRQEEWLRDRCKIILIIQGLLKSINSVRSKASGAEI